MLIMIGGVDSAVIIISQRNKVAFFLKNILFYKNAIMILTKPDTTSCFDSGEIHLPVFKH